MRLKKETGARMFGILITTLKGFHAAERGTH